MSLRAVKKIKQQVEQEKEVQSSSSENSEAEPEIRESAFGALAQSGSDSSVEEQKEQKQQEVKKQKKQQKKQKKKKVENNKKQVEEEEEDFDKLINELSVNQQQETTEQETQNQTQKSKISSLSRQMKFFNHQVEINKLFNKRQQIQKDKKNKRRRIWVQGEEMWPQNQEYNYIMELEKSENDIYYFSFIHTSKSKKVAKEFERVLQTHDPEFVHQFLAQYPFHCQALFQMCQIFKLSNNYEQARQLIERCLFSYENVFHHLFSPLRTDVRVNFKNPESKVMFFSLAN